MADIVAIPDYFGSANSYGGIFWGGVQRQQLQNFTLVVDNCTHGHTVDDVMIVQQHSLVVSDASHSHIADNVTITQQHTLTVADAIHSTTSDNVWVIYNVTLTVDNTVHNHIVDNIDIVQQHLIAVASANHALTYDNTVLSQQHTIVVNDTTHSLTIDGNLVLNQFLLMNKPDDAVHGITSDNAVLTGNHILAVDNSKHILHLDEPGIVNWADLEKYFGIYKPGTGQYGSLSASELADLNRLYSNLVVKNGSLNAVLIDIGIHRQKYGETGELLAVGLLTGILKPDITNGNVLVQQSIDAGSIVINAINIGDFLANRPLRVLMFGDGYAWLSEDGVYHILEESGNEDRIQTIPTGILKQGNIEYGRL